MTENEKPEVEKSESEKPAEPEAPKAAPAKAAAKAEASPAEKRAKAGGAPEGFKNAKRTLPVMSAASLKREAEKKSGTKKGSK